MKKKKFSGGCHSLVSCKSSGKEIAGPLVVKKPLVKKAIGIYHNA